MNVDGRPIGLASPPPPFRRGVRELRFTFGEFTVGRARFAAWVARPHTFTSTAALAAVPDSSTLPADVSVIAIQSLPVECDLPALATSGGLLRYVPAHFSHHVIDIRGTFEDYIASISGKSRHEMARKVRRFETFAAGRHQLREYRSAASMEEFLARAVALSRMTYQGRLLAAGLPDGPDFKQDLEQAAARDDVRGYLLEVAGKPVAYGYCRAEGDVLLFEHTGYDPDTAPHSPGIFLLREILTRVHAEYRFRVFDFGTGDAQYKRSYATSTRRCATVLYFRPTLRNALLVRLHRAMTAMSDASVGLLKKLGIKDRLKRLLRRG
jgi:CelD/BcsL family acetyltransferase involved in cellulose biosynthesis